MNDKDIEAARREREEFLRVGPSAAEMIDAISDEFGVTDVVALAWLRSRLWAEIEVSS
jgi:hypothetical protein